MFVNLTPHTINVYKHDNTHISIPPSGAVARVSVEYTVIDNWDGVYVRKAHYGEITGLPDTDKCPKTGEPKIYIVSGMVAAAVSRGDVMSPGELIRDENGRPVGCNGLKTSV